MNLLPRRTAVLVFVAFATAYFLSSLIRAITATLSPVLTQEFALNARDLGLLAGGYFLGFAATQLPLGGWLDRFGPKKVILCLMMLALCSCGAFALARGFQGLLVARILSGIGVSACLMAPLTGYRRWFDPAMLMRANSWMLMVGALGMVASTLPVQWLLPMVGWRALFWLLGLLVVGSMALIAWQVPGWALAPPGAVRIQAATSGYAEVWRHPYFRKMAPIGFFSYGGLIAIQTLWATPWMIKVAGYTPLRAAEGLFWINVAMLLAYWAWGLANPWLTRHGLHADRLIGFGLPTSFVLLAIIVIAGAELSMWTSALWGCYCVSCTFIALSQPAVAMAFEPGVAGRALTAYNLLLFAGAFTVQWGVGLAVDGFQALGSTEPRAFQFAMGLFLVCSVLAYVFFLTAKSHNRPLPG